MCLSKSKSSSSTSQTSNQSDERIAAADGSIAIRLDDGASIEVIDPGIIDAAADALESFEAVNSAALGFAEGASSQAAALTTDVLNKARTEGAQAVEQVLKIGAIVAVVAIIASQAPRFVKG